MGRASFFPFGRIEDAAAGVTSVSYRRRRMTHRLQAQKARHDDGDVDGEVVDDDDDDKNGARNLQLLTSTVCLSMLSFGAATGAIAGALIFLEQGTALGTLTTASKSIVVAATPFGALVGAVAIAPRFSAALGRRTTLLATNAVYIIGAAVMAASFTHTQLALGRWIAGVAVGVSTSVCTLYISECAPAATRGSLTSLSPLAGTCGILLSYFASLALSGVDGGWRAMLSLCAAPAVCQLCMRGWLVESPRWLAEMGRVEEASRVLARLGQRGVPLTAASCSPTTTTTRRSTSSRGVEATAEERRMETISGGSNSGGGRGSGGSGDGVNSRRSGVVGGGDGGGSGWSRLLQPAYRRATTAAVGLNLLQQLCGINVVGPHVYDPKLPRIQPFPPLPPPLV